ncbi:MAG: hypothetical protein SFY96_02890 [Planctomycetota bacterium]|nr:hypothetical protein [Planctomycetota bacterium]
MSASFEEKSVWVQLIAMTVALGVYFFIAGRMLASGVHSVGAFAALFMIAVVFMVVLMVIAYVVAALTTKVEGRDERDRLIAWKAEHHSAWLTAVGMLGAVACMAAGVNNVWTANLLLLSLAVAEILGFVLRIVYYRRGV